MINHRFSCRIGIRGGLVLIPFQGSGQVLSHCKSYTILLLLEARQLALRAVLLRRFAPEPVPRVASTFCVLI